MTNVVTVNKVNFKDFAFIIPVLINITLPTVNEENECVQTFKAAIWSTNYFSNHSTDPDRIFSSC